MPKQLIVLIYILIITTSSQAAKPPANGRIEFENADIRIRMIPRTPEQIAAFYEARKFPANMISRLKKECFITVGVHNKTKDILWLELANWSFHSEGKTIRRYHRHEWRTIWQELAVPMASQSTFRWTLLPEMLDFRPDEHEGGNIILERTNRPISINARFSRGANKNLPPLDIKIDNVICAGATT